MRQLTPIDRYRSPDDLPKRIALFPLRGVILLPRADLPLNVFEPRYLSLVTDVLSGNRIVGIIQPETTSGVPESPQGRSVPLKRIGCAGRLTAYRELADGRFHITLTGVARFVVQNEADSSEPYRLADVGYDKYSLDLADDESAEEIDREALLGVLKAFLATRRLQADWDAVERAPLEPLINGLSLMSPFGPEERQALLEAENLSERAKILMTLAEMAIAGGDMDDGGRMQ
ncbi:MAG: LON peptidase substrate-binding domain-containing protein [Hyphomicrobiaceae bacterium]